MQNLVKTRLKTQIFPSFRSYLRLNRKLKHTLIAQFSVVVVWSIRKKVKGKLCCEKSIIVCECLGNYGILVSFWVNRIGHRHDRIISPGGEDYNRAGGTKHRDFLPLAQIVYSRNRENTVIRSRRRGRISLNRRGHNFT